jgi:hypothetical protein
MCLLVGKENNQIFYTPLESNILYFIIIRSVTCLQEDKEKKQIFYTPLEANILYSIIVRSVKCDMSTGGQGKEANILYSIRSKFSILYYY